LEDLPKKTFPVVWRRPKEIFGDKPFRLLSDKIGPDQIEQGRLGDCWFMAALSIISGKTELLDNMFVTKMTNDQGVYKMRFFRSDEWVDVVVDDYLPCLPLTGFPTFDVESLQLAKTALPGPTFNIPYPY